MKLMHNPITRRAAAIELIVAMVLFSYGCAYFANLKKLHAHFPKFYVLNDASQVVFLPIIKFRQQFSEKPDWSGLTGC